MKLNKYFIFHQMYVMLKPTDREIPDLLKEEKIWIWKKC